MKLNKIVEKAREWIGTPFHEQGRHKGIGCDCVGLILGIAKDIGAISLTGKPWDKCDMSTYDTDEDSQIMLELLPKNFPTAKKQFELGNILLIEIIPNKYHVCLITDEMPLRIIHSCSSIGVVTEHRIIPSWKKQIKGCFSFNFHPSSQQQPPSQPKQLISGAETSTLTSSTDRIYTLGELP
jgi:hypothetical protein